MRFLLIIAFFFFTVYPVVAQVVEPATSILEQQMENATEHNEDNETEDDSYLQQLQGYLKNPLNLNSASEDDLARVQLLNPLQIHQLIAYRKLLGPLLSIYELQAVPLWNPELIHKIRPYITVSMHTDLLKSYADRFKHGQHSVLLRAGQVLEKSKGYLLKGSPATNFYPGSPQQILFRYKYVYKQLLQYGITGEKDAGEQFFKGKQKLGFDFYSFHLFASHIGIIKTFALGDFTVNLGQGLTQWQSLAFKKNADVINIKRQEEILRPYNSAGEINFHRGMGITLAKNKWQASIFVSYKKIDANLVTDSLAARPDFVSSLQTSGYHRTQSEITDKAVQHQLTFGGNISYQYHNLHLGLNAIRFLFKLPFIKTGEPYNKYAISGKTFINYSLDFSFTYKNFHVFGEAALNQKLQKAFVGGIMMALSSSVDMSLLYRNISKSYTSLYAAAFTENTSPVNEKGFYIGITVRPNSFWRIDAYADFYSFPWLKYRVNMPSAGTDFLIQVNYNPNKQLEIYTRYHNETKSININLHELTMSPVIAQPKQNWRTQINFKISPSLILRNRVEMVWFDIKGREPEKGYLAYFDLLYKPVLKPYSGNIRVQYFETDGYNSRLYAYENDVLNSFSIPVFYDKGYRYYFNAGYDINKKLTIWLKWAQTLFSNKNLIGSGLDEIKANKKSELRVQISYKF